MNVAVLAAGALGALLAGRVLAGRRPTRRTGADDLAGAEAARAHGSLGRRRLPGLPGRRSRIARRRGDPGDGALVDWLDRIARDLRSGGGLAGAVGEALDAPGCPPPMQPAHLALRRGGSVRDALGAVRSDDADVVTAVQVLVTCAEVGGPAAEAVDRVASVLRERAAARADRQAHAAQALLSARVLTFVPLAYATWGAARDARLRDVYLHSRPAQAAVAIGLVLCLAGWRWMRHLVESPW